MRTYFKNRRTLKRVLILLDARHGIKLKDEELFRLLDEFDVPYQVVITKTDLVLPNDLARFVVFVVACLLCFCLFVFDREHLFSGHS